MAEHAGYTVGIDIGGTFTDFVLLSPDGLPAGVHKCLTTPHDPSEACLVGLRALLDGAGVEVGQVGRVVHGTTLAVNAITERKGARTALLTTRGFRDVLELRTEQRYDAYDLGLAFPEPLVPRRWRRDVSERTLRDGTLQIALDRDEVARILRDLGGERVQAIAVSFLHAYVNPANEQAARAVIEATLPDVHVSISSEVAPEIREFQRTSTVVANAYVQPLVRHYLERLHLGLRSAGCRAPLHLMLSSGGTALPETAVRFPIRLLESGPAAGAAAAAFLARAAGQSAVIGFDMGGTTAKISVVDNGQPSHTGEQEVARVHRFKRGSGLPVRLPSVDLLEIGAGGGSIAHMDRLGLLKVGPQSAGADPAPACYG
ncbi:MAG: hydantoinase/oxoprolinase family protein, partial [Armatimonadetes bacterium]|nr:hydantoinase/oxoprolinase family protein [Armatimonadota bacterium]